MLLDFQSMCMSFLKPDALISLDKPQLSQMKLSHLVSSEAASVLLLHLRCQSITCTAAAVAFSLQQSPVMHSHLHPICCQIHSNPTLLQQSG